MTERTGSLNTPAYAIQVERERDEARAALVKQAAQLADAQRERNDIEDMDNVAMDKMQAMIQELSERLATETDYAGACTKALQAIVTCDDEAKHAKGKAGATLNGYGLVDLFDCVNHPLGAGEHKQQPYRSQQLDAALEGARAALAQTIPEIVRPNGGMETALLEDIDRMREKIHVLGEALKHQRTALMIVRDRQGGRASDKDIDQGIKQIDAALSYIPPEPASGVLAVGTPQADEDRFLVAFGGDGGDSYIVSEADLLEAYLAIVAGDDADLRARCTEYFNDEDQWQMVDTNLGRIRYVLRESFEDGWLAITRILGDPPKGVLSQGNPLADAAREVLFVMECGNTDEPGEAGRLAAARWTAAKKGLRAALAALVSQGTPQEPTR